MSVSGEGWLGVVVSRGSEEGKGREAKGGLIGAGWRRGAKNLAERIVAGDFGSLLGAEDEEGPRAGEEGHQGRVGAEQHTHTGGGARSGFFPQPAVCSRNLLQASMSSGRFVSQRSTSPGSDSKDAHAVGGDEDGRGILSKAWVGRNYFVPGAAGPPGRA